MLFVLGSCGLSGRFDSDDMKWIDPYEHGDTIVFKSSREEFDTTVIVSIERSRKNDWGEIIRHVAVKYSNGKFKPDSDPETLISITKFETGEAQMVISYLGTFYVVGNPDSIYLKTYSKEADCLVLNTYGDGEPDYEPKTIYWRVDSGLVRYVSHDDVMWRRIK